MENDKNTNDEIDLLEYLIVIFKYKWFIVGVTLLVAVFVGVRSFKSPPVFEATASFFCLDAIRNSKNLNINGSSVSSDMVISIMQSRKMIDKIIATLKLDQYWPSNIREEIRKAVADSTNISLEKGNIIRISIITDKPEISMNMANLYLDELDEFNRELELSANASIIQVLDRAILPEKRMARGTIKKVIKTSIITLILLCLMVLFFESLKKSNVVEKFKEFNKIY